MPMAHEELMSLERQEQAARISRAANAAEHDEDILEDMRKDIAGIKSDVAKILSILERR